VEKIDLKNHFIRGMSVKRAEQVILQKNHKQRGQQKYLKKQQSQNTFGSNNGHRESDKIPQMESDGEGPFEDRQNNMQDNGDDGTGLGQII
jgi:hypothetical protein